MKPTRIASALLLLLAGCSGSSGYLKTDVLEPKGLGAAAAAGVRIQGDAMTDGTLTWQGKGDVQSIYLDYVEAMRGEGWSPHSADGDPATGIQCTLRKDHRQADVAITPAGSGDVKVVVRVSPDK